MEIDTIIKVHLNSGYIIQDECNYIALISCLKDVDDYLMSYKHIIPKINIEFIETTKIEGGNNE